MVSAGEIEATMRLRDEITAPLARIAAAQQRMFAQQAAEAERAAAAVKAAMERSALAGIAASEKQARAVAAAAKQMAAAQADAQAAAQAAARQTEQVWATTGQTMSRVGGTISTTIGLPLGLAGAAAFKFSTDYDTAMTKVETLSGVARERVAAMRGEVVKLSGDTAKGPKELAEGLLVVTSTGLRGAEAMQILTAAAKLSTAGLGETRDIARAMTAAMTAYGKENLMAAEASNKLFIAVREGGAEASEFAGTLGRVVGIAAQMGVSFDEVVAQMATFTRLGISADEAATSLRGTLSILLAPTDKTREAMAKLGTSIDEVRRSVRERGLADTMIDLVKLSKGNFDAIGELIPNVRSLAGVLGTAGAQAGAYREVLEKVRTETGADDAAFRRMTETVGFRWNQALRDASNAMLSMGDAASGTFTSMIGMGSSLVTNVLVPMANAFGRLPEPLKALVIGVGAFGVALGPVLYVSGNLITAWSSMTGLLGTLVVRIGAASSAAAVLQLGLYGLVAATIAGGLYLLYTRLRDVGTEMEHMSGQPIKGTTDSLGRAMMTIEQANAALDKMSVGTLDAHGKLEAFIPALIRTGDGGKGAGAGLGNAGVGAANFSAQLAAAQKVVDGLSEAQRQNIKAGLALGTNTEKIAEAMHLAVGAVELYKDSLQDARTEMEELIETHDTMISKSADQLGYSMKLGRQQTLFRPPLMDQAVTQGAPGELVNRANMTLLSGLANRASGGGYLSGLLPGGHSQIFSAPTKGPGGAALLDYAHGATPYPRPPGPSVFAGFGDMVRTQLGPTILSAFTGGGHVGQSIGGLLGGSLLGKDGIGGAISKGLSGALGKTLGGALGSVMPGLGTILGGVAGKLFGKLFGGGEGKEVQRLRQQFEDAAGGAETLRRAADKAGVSLDALYSTKKVADFKRLAEEAQGQLKQFGDEQAADAARLTAAIEKYGFTFEQLGPALQRQNLDKMAKELIEDWRVLAGASIDLVAIDERMAASMNEYLRVAIRTGIEVPAAMVPILEKMAAQGLLVDASGAKITNLSEAGITFSQTMTQGFDRVVSKLRELIDRLNATGAAMHNIPSQVTTTITTVHEDVFQSQDILPRLEDISQLPPPPGYHWGGDGWENNTEGYHSAVHEALGGAGRVHQPTLFLAGESGPEDYAFSGANRTFSDATNRSDIERLHRELVLARADMRRRDAALPILIRDAVLQGRR